MYFIFKSLSNYLVYAVIFLFIETISAIESTNKELDKLLLNQEKILPADEVFKLSAKMDDSRIKFVWTIKKNNYLYLDKFSFEIKNKGIYKEPVFPMGRILEDEFFGKVEVFFDNVETSFVINESLPAKIIVTYQGCNQIGYCYLPIKKYVHIDKSLQAIIH